MDRGKFFAAVRSDPFGGRLTQVQVEGCEAILDACDRGKVTDSRHQANILAQCHHETGGQMEPVKETVFAWSKDRHPSDAEVIRRLDAAFAKGQLPWVKTPYWRDGWFGRGLIQLTFRDNYDKLGKAIGVDLVGGRERALELRTSADIAVVGMRDGLFTGKKLADFLNATRDDPAAARAIVNGDTPKIGPEIAKLHRAFLAALKGASTDPVAAWRAAAPASIDAIRAWLQAMPQGAEL